MPERIPDVIWPRPGRIYDYLLGGHHNLEVDREIGGRVLAITPFASKAKRLQNWCLQDLATELTEQRGYDVIIDRARIAHPGRPAASFTIEQLAA